MINRQSSLQNSTKNLGHDFAAGNNASPQGKYARKRNESSKGKPSDSHLWKKTIGRVCLFIAASVSFSILAVAATFQNPALTGPKVSRRSAFRPASSPRQQDAEKAVFSTTTRAIGGSVSIKGPSSNPNQSVWIEGQKVDQWRLGSYQVFELSRPTFRQGQLHATAEKAIVWLDHNSSLPSVIGQVNSSQSVHVAVAYLEGNVKVDHFHTDSGGPQGGHADPDITMLDRNRGTERSKVWFHSFYSYQDIAVRSSPTFRTNGMTFDPQFRKRALAYWQNQSKRTQAVSANASITSSQASIEPLPSSAQSFPVTKVIGGRPDGSFVAPAQFGQQVEQGSAAAHSPNSVPIAGTDGYRPSHTPAGLGTPNLRIPNLQTGSPSSNLQSSQSFRNFSTQPTIGASGTQNPGSSDPSATFGYGTFRPQTPLSSANPPRQSTNSTGQGGASGIASQLQRVQIFPRSTGVDLNIQNVPGRVPGEQMILGTGGAKVVIASDAIGNSSIAGAGTSQLIIQADNLVAWTNQLPSLGGRPDAPRWELFLEGNVVFSIGNRVVNATKMYYDVNQQIGVILDVEMLTPIPQYEGLIRLRADVLHQINQNNFQAHRAAVTTSRIGKPRYWLQSDTLDLNRSQAVQTDPITGITPFDPQTGLLATEDRFSVSSRNNFIYLWGRPILYWPFFRTSLEDPEYYLKGLTVKNDSIFGFQVLSDWNMYQVLGRDPIAGTKWKGGLDYLSERGIGLESVFSYNRANGFFLPGRIEGVYDSWFLLNDDGLDTLGFDRRDLAPEESTRGRSLWTHRTYLQNGDRVTGQFGWISDRNFLEQFYEREWDQRHDQYTNIAWERVVGNRRFSVIGQANINEFFTQTQWLPKAEYTSLGQSILNGPWNVSTKAHVGYADLKVADAPTNAVEIAKFDPLAWEAEREGIRVGVRSEISRPFQFGAMKLTPYALGDATYWGEDLTGNDITRVYGQFGIRSDLPMWKVDPSIRSEIWNLNGLAHKVNFYSHFFYADASQDLEEFPLYDPLDDDAQEHFRRRFAFDTFGIVAGGNVANQFDERFFALRSGLQSYVTSPANEIADDQTQFQFGVNQRWQTKRGAPGREKVIDWITLDMKATLFPKEDRDNFGETFGLAEFDFRWHIGDRLSILADGYLDTYQDGLRTASVGLHASRPLLGDLYLGVRTIDGAIRADVLNARVNYRLSPKWILKASTSWDFGSDTGQIGQLFSAVYVGESFLWQVGTHTDFSRDNVGFVFSLEPRVLPRGKLSRLGGVNIPPPGVLGLE